MHTENQNSMPDCLFKFFSWFGLLDPVTITEVFLICLALIATAFIIYEEKRSKKKYNLPPGPTGVPILGYLPFLGREPFKELDRLKGTYGNVFSLYMGRTFIVFLGDFEAVKDAFSKSTTIDRPEKLFDFIPDGLGFSSVNGEEWSEQRKFCVKTIRDLGVGKEKWEMTIQEEVDDFIDVVASFKGQPFDISEILASSFSNNISYFVFGRRLPRTDPDRLFLDKAMDDVAEGAKQSGLSLYFPVIRDIQITLGIGNYARIHKNLQRFNNFFRNEVRKLKETCKSSEDTNFTVEYLKEMEDNKTESNHYFNETNLYGNIQALFQGGSATTRTSLHWLILIMARFPDIQAIVREEIDSVLGRDGRMKWSERKKVPYTYATIMEGQRWRTIAPLNTSRIAMEDIQIQGYDVPQGTTIIANNWGINNDPKYWKNPEKFDPERFLTPERQVILKPDSYVPFSYGKRNCPGETIAMMEILLYFTALMQKFRIVVPEGRTLNMDGSLGWTYQAMRQDLHFIARDDSSIISQTII